MLGLEEEEEDPLRSDARAHPAYLGKYELCATLDIGGQAEVYLALMRGQAGFNKLVVIKKLRSVAVDDPVQVNMFLNEARLAARLNHPNIVHTYEVGSEGSAYFIAMEYLEGQPMNRLTHHPLVRQSFTPAMWATVASKVLNGLAYAHNLTDYDGTPLETIHRDISPDNLFLTYDGEVKIVDFGVARALLNHGKTETGALKGKVHYMAPEQVRGKIDQRADLFGMGVVLWEFLTGKKLFDGERGPVLYRLMTEPIPPLVSALPDVPPSLAAIVDRALAKDPDQRFQTAAEMREALDEFIRASNEVVSDQQLGKVVREAYGEIRQRVQKQIQAAMSRTVPEATTTSAVMAALPAIVSVTPSQSMAIPWAGRAVGSSPHGELSPHSEVRSSASATISPTAPALPRWMRLVIVGTAVLALGAVMITLFVALRTKRPEPAPVAPVEITSEPPGARVELDGNVLGYTPGRFNFAPGPHTLIVAKDAYKPAAIVVAATESPTSHAVRLTPVAPSAPPDVAKAVDEPPKPNSKPVVLTPVEPEPVAPSQATPPPRQPPPRQPPPRIRASAPPARAKETAPARPVGAPRVKVIEEEPKQHNIEVINDKD